MNTVSNTVSTVATALTGYGWAAYFACSSVAVAVTAAVTWTTERNNHG